MELFDQLENRVVELLGQIDSLREENRTLQETALGLAELREENRALNEALEQEKRTKEEINGRIDTLLATIREYTTEA
ncbi:MAG: cell division protein ZapB [Bilophila sp.]